MAKKQKIREIPYRVYKKMFPDCPANNYHDGKITVEFPEDYLNSKLYTPDGWNRGGNYIHKFAGRTCSGSAVSMDVAWFSDGGCKYYDVTITIGNVFAGGSMKRKQFIRSFDTALEIANKMAEEVLK